MITLYERFCPECKKIIKYKHIVSFKRACKENSFCGSCAKKGNRHPNFGKSPWNKGKKNSQVPWHKGKTNVYSDETLKKMSDAKKGRKLSIEIKEKIRASNINKHNNIISEEAKRKMRISASEEFLKSGRKRRIDRGFLDWIEKKKEEGYNFIPDFYIKDLGYFVDGYDKEKHIIVEYDTLYHCNISQKEKDLIRQKNIIDYYKNIGCPINSFWRIDVINNEKINIQ